MFQIKKISLIICTYNRAEILSICLSSITNQNISSELFEIIVVDNNSTDNTALIVKSFTEKHSNLSYYIESQIGLCHARNKGLNEAKSSWVGFLDDDIKVNNKFVENIFFTINTKNFDIFGGCYHSWFYFGKPRWFPHDFETNWHSGTKLGLITNKENVWGAAMFFKRTILLKIDGFPIHLGMTGKKIAYGEETFVINVLKSMGYKIGINPNVIIHHLVGKHKLKLSWHLKSAFAKARDGYIANFIKKEDRPTLIKSFYLLFRLLLTSSIRATHSILTKKDFYWQNWIYDIAIPFCTYIGTIYAIFKNKLNT